MKKKNNDFLSVYDKESLNELASSIADFHFPRGVINPEIIAEKNNITYSYGYYDDSFDGLIEFRNNKFHIYINVDRLGHAYTERARFTFAHELGHFFIDSHRNSLKLGQSPSHCSFTGFVNNNKAERQADYFASCLLLPEYKIHKDCHKRKFNFSLIQELAKKYQTSISATALRFSAIGNHPIMVVYSKKNEIVWYWSSDDFPYWKLRNGKYKVPEDTVVGEYFNLSRKPKNTQTVFAMDWFSNVWKSDINREFKEHCLYHDNQVLSIVWEE